MAVYRPKYRNRETGEPVEQGVFWCDFTYQGKRVRESTGQTLKTLAVKYEETRRREIERAFAGLASEPAEGRIKSVAEALDAYAKGYGINHRRNSMILVKGRVVHVKRLLGSLLLPDLTTDRITAYMEKRRAEDAAGRTINLELMVLSRALGFTWKALWPRVKKLAENRDVGRALEGEEEARLLASAARNSSPLIYPYVTTLAWTGMRADEARTLTWEQVDFEAGHIVVGRSKTEAGAGRVIPLSGNLRAALEHHLSWYARKLGPVRPDWYVFPKMNRTRPVDPSSPCLSLKTSWDTVRTEAKVSCRMHDLRHSFCTKLAEAGVPEATMLDMMGHVSPTMLRRYSHIRAQARRDAITAVEARQFPGVRVKDSPKVDRSSEPKSSVSC